MTSRGKTVFVFALFGAVVSFFTVAAVFVIVTGRHADAVAEADAAAHRFSAAMAAYDEQTTSKLERLHGETHFARALQAVDTQLSRAPKLKRLSGYGPENSAAYKKAAEVRPSDALWSLRQTLEVALQEQTYVVEARKALLAPGSTVTADDPFRAQTIPKLKALQSAYEQISVPPEAESADTKVRAVFDFIITQGSSRDSVSDMQVGDRAKPVPSYDAAKSAVDAVEKKAHAKVAAALKSVTS